MGEQTAKHLQQNQRVMKPDARLLEACEALRHAVEHPGERSEIIMNQGIYKQIDPEAIQTVTVDGVEIGYKVKAASLVLMNPYFDRYVYFKTPGARLKDLSKEELTAIKTAILEAFFEPQQGKIHIEVIGWDAILLWQRFMVCFPVQKNPNVISLVGGFGPGPKKLNG